MAEEGDSLIPNSIAGWATPQVWEGGPPCGLLLGPQRNVGRRSAMRGRTACSRTACVDGPQMEGGPLQKTRKQVGAELEYALAQTALPEFCQVNGGGIAEVVQ